MLQPDPPGGTPGSQEFRHLRLLVEYAGEKFAGWQIQPEARTVQGELERALAEITRQEIRVHGASRTDRGVHAYGQVVSFALDWPFPLRKLERGLNAVLPEDVAVVDVAETGPEFHARFLARGKIYRYRILNGPNPSPLEAGRAHYEPRPLDVAAMQEAGRLLTGLHDFKAFVSRPDGDGDCRRTLFRVEAAASPLPNGRGQLVTLEVEGDGFLYKMVRTIAGTLVEVGRGDRPASSMREVLASRDRRRAGNTAPGHGLYLVRVHYDQSNKAQLPGVRRAVELQTSNAEHGTRSGR